VNLETFEITVFIPFLTLEYRKNKCESEREERKKYGKYYNKMLKCG
jgi:hypothetical protein